jgi:hypothetical protein
MTVHVAALLSGLIGKCKFTVLLCYLTLYMLGALVYLSSLHGDFVFDDIHAIVNNADVDASKSTLKDVFLDNFWGSPMFSPTAEHQVYY